MKDILDLSEKTGSRLIRTFVSSTETQSHHSLSTTVLGFRDEGLLFVVNEQTGRLRYKNIKCSK